jgi:hypothetical protein
MFKPKCDYGNSAIFYFWERPFVARYFRAEVAVVVPPEYRKHVSYIYKWAWRDRLRRLLLKRRGVKFPWLAGEVGWIYKP